MYDVSYVTGSPEPPLQLVVDAQVTSIQLTWTNGDEGDSPIQGYIIQGRQRGGEQCSMMHSAVLYEHVLVLGSWLPAKCYSTSG